MSHLPDFPPRPHPASPSTRRPAGTTGRALRLGSLLAPLLLAACAQPPGALGLTDLLARPAERALSQGLRAYEDGQYTDAERYFVSALKAGPMAGTDRAAAHKHLAFIYCTSSRVPACEEAFLAARRADAAFVLSRSEAGHPVWGPVYRRVLP